MWYDLFSSVVWKCMQDTHWKKRNGLLAMDFFSLTLLQEEGYICWKRWKLLWRPPQRDLKVHHIHFLKSFHWSFCLSFTQGNLHIFYFFEAYNYYLFESYEGLTHLSGKLSSPGCSKRARVHVAQMKGASFPHINPHHPFLLQSSQTTRTFSWDSWFPQRDHFAWLTSLAWKIAVLLYASWVSGDIRV